MRGPNPALPATVSQGNNAGCWNTTPRSGPGPVTACPSRLTTPEVGFRNPASVCIIVVLPQPDGPTMHTKSPRAKPSSARSSARTADAPAP